MDCVPKGGGFANVARGSSLGSRMTEQPLRITNETREAMLRHFRREFPREACGLLAGSEGVAYRYYPINNLNTRRLQFMMDPSHTQRTETSILRRGQRILAVCHSHPEGDCYPTGWEITRRFLGTDLMLPAWAGEIQVIALLDESAPPEIRGFQILPGDEVREIGLETIPGDVRTFSTSP